MLWIINQKIPITKLEITTLQTNNR
jgi:hypothetical protein